MPTSREILPFPAKDTFTPEQALASAAQFDLTQVYIIGFTEDGDLVIRSSRMSRAEALWLAERGRRHALGD